MHRALAFLFAVSWWWFAAQADPVTPDDLAAVKADLTEDYKLLRTDFSSLEQRFEVLARNQQQLLDQIRRVESENRALREAITKATTGLVTRKELEQVVEQIREVDKKRVDDGKAIRETLDRLGDQIERLGKLASAPPVVVPPPPVEKPRGTRESDKPPKSEEPTTDLPSEFYEHVVQERESIGLIIAAYNKEHGLKVKLSDVMKANPKLKDPKRLLVGQKLRIPAVK